MKLYKKAAKQNPWIQYVKDFASLNGISYKEAMIVARPSYNSRKIT